MTKYSSKCQPAKKAPEPADVLTTPNFRKPCAQRLPREREDAIIADMRLKHLQYFGIDGTDRRPSDEASMALLGETKEKKRAIASASARYAEYYTHFLLNTGEGYNRQGLLNSRNEFIEESKTQIGEHSTRIVLRATEKCVSDAFETILGKGV